MKRNLSALFLCLLMIASSLAGCMGTDDSVDDSAVTELENEITMQDEKIAELEAEVATLTTQHQDAVAELAAVQAMLQTTQTSLDSAEANSTMHQAEISSLEAERDIAQAEISMLYELMSNMSDQSNETFESMALQIAELNQHISNLSSMLNESYDRHQENATLVSQLTAERDTLQVALDNANNIIAGYLESASDAEALAELQDHVHGIIGANALDPETNGDPKVSITNNGFHTYFSYTSNISSDHTVFVEFCNSSFDDSYENLMFNFATGIQNLNIGVPWSYQSNLAYRLHYLEEGSTDVTFCYVLQTDISENQFNHTFSYPYLGLFETNNLNGNSELYISVCIGDYLVTACPNSGDWYHPYDDHINYISTHYFVAGDIIPVTIVGELPCTLGFVQDPSGSCQPPVCTDVRNRVVTGVYVLENCEVVSINTELLASNVNHTLNNVSTYFYNVNNYGDAELYVCDADADAHLYLERNGGLDVYILSLGEDDEYTISTGTGYDQGTLVTTQGGLLKWNIQQFADFSINHWTDPDGVC